MLFRSKTRQQSGSSITRDHSPNELDYCMKRALEAGVQLHGPEGHHLRVAIVVKAQVIGMDEEETAKLFQHQDNYNYDITKGKVDEIRGYDYQPWSCDTLRDKCGKLVADYCRTCPLVEYS